VNRYVGSNDKFLYAVDVETGKLRWKKETCANVYASAAISDDGMLYTTCNTGTGSTLGKGKGVVYAIDPAKQQPDLGILAQLAQSN
jgi:outer membrane protein assembly factor BamB